LTVHAIIWDIMGTSTLRDLLKEAYYNGAEGIFTVADKTRRETLGAIDSWVASIRSVAGDIPTVGLVNKQDLEPDPAFASGEIEAFFEKRGWPWMYTSAKTGSGVEEAFQRLVEALRDRRAASEGRHVEGDRVAFREAVLLREDLDSPLVEGPGEGLRIPDDLVGVFAAEREDLREGDPEGGHRMEVMVRDDAGEDGPLQPLEELLVLGVGQEDAMLRPWKRLVRRAGQDVRPFVERIL